jgi:hypothetical protein
MLYHLNLARFIVGLHPHWPCSDKELLKPDTKTATLSEPLPHVGRVMSGPYKPKALTAFIYLLITVQRIFKKHIHIIAFIAAYVYIMHF